MNQPLNYTPAYYTPMQSSQPGFLSSLLSYYTNPARFGTDLLGQNAGAGIGLALGGYPVGSTLGGIGGAYVANRTKKQLGYDEPLGWDLFGGALSGLIPGGGSAISGKLGLSADDVFKQPLESLTKGVTESVDNVINQTGSLFKDVTKRVPDVRNAIEETFGKALPFNDIEQYMRGLKINVTNANPETLSKITQNELRQSLNTALPNKYGIESVGNFNDPLSSRVGSVLKGYTEGLTSELPEKLGSLDFPSFNQDLAQRATKLYKLRADAFVDPYKTIKDVGGDLSANVPKVNNVINDIQENVISQSLNPKKSYGGLIEDLHKYDKPQYTVGQARQALRELNDAAEEAFRQGKSSVAHEYRRIANAIKESLPDIAKEVDPSGRLYSKLTKTNELYSKFKALPEGRVGQYLSSQGSKLGIEAGDKVNTDVTKFVQQFQTPQDVEDFTKLTGYSKDVLSKTTAKGLIEKMQKPTSQAVRQEIGDAGQAYNTVVNSGEIGANLNHLSNLMRKNTGSYKLALQDQYDIVNQLVSDFNSIAPHDELFKSLAKSTNNGVIEINIGGAMTRAIKDPTGRFNNLPPEVQQAWRRVLQTIDYLSKEK